MADVENTLNDDKFFGDIVDTPKKGIYQHRKRGCLKSAIGSGKAYLLGRKWRRKKVNKASHETINKTYDAYKQRELNEKDEKTGNTIGKHVISLYSTRISWVVKIKYLKKLQQDIENDPIIKDQMANLGCLLVYTFGNFLAPVAVAANTVNNLAKILAMNLQMRVMKVIKKTYFWNIFCYPDTKRDKKMALYCHRKINPITCVCGYMGAYHACDHVINRTITICPCPDNCKICQKEVCLKREYYIADGKKMKTDTMSVECAWKS